MATEARSKKTDGLGVLIVDDDFEMASLIDAVLRDMGIVRIGRAEDGKIALGEYQADPDQYDIIISDWEMPSMSGLELLRAVREVRSGVPFLMLTVRSGNDAIETATEAGVTGYITKPFKPRDLHIKMATIIEDLLADDDDYFDLDAL